MILWRISNHSTLDGGGGLVASGRWHTAGRPIVYCAPNPATALLEVLVHNKVALDGAPTGFRYLAIEAPETLESEEVNADLIGPAWRTDVEATRRHGNQWLTARRTALLRVPSVLVPETWNVLLNPQHPQSKKVRIARVHHYSIDAHLLR